jgi:hypothetical protein
MRMYKLTTANKTDLFSLLNGFRHSYSYINAKIYSKITFWKFEYWTSEKIFLCKFNQVSSNSACGFAQGFKIKQSNNDWNSIPNH